MEEKKSEENTFNMGANTPSNKNFKPSKRLFSLKWLLVLIIFVVYSVGLVAVTYKVTQTLDVRGLKNVLLAFHDSNSPLFLNLTGNFNGRITEVKGDKAWVTTDKGGKVILSIQDSVYVAELTNGKFVEIGATVDKIKLNESASIHVKGYGSGYIITSVVYNSGEFPEFKIPETASNSAKQASSSAKNK